LTSETAQSHERPYCLDDSEGPSPGNEAVGACKGASEREGEHESGVPRLQGVHDHHEGKGAYPEGRQQRPWSLGRERNRSRSGECGGEAGEHHEVGVERDALQPAYAERDEAVVMLQSPKFPFHGGAALVEAPPPPRVAGDKRVASVGLYPPGGRSHALAGRAAPLRRLALEVRPRERPIPMLAPGETVRVCLHGGSHAERDDRYDSRPLARLVHRRHVVPLIERCRLGIHALPPGSRGATSSRLASRAVRERRPLPRRHARDSKSSLRRSATSWSTSPTS
jgi:hypothetical protein